MPWPRTWRPLHWVPPKSLLLNASHTHCGPQIKGVDEALTGEETGRDRQAREYVEQLKDKVVEVVGRAMAQSEPVKLDYLHARAGFAMNRRRPTPQGIANASNPEGPVDHDVPVLRVTAADGKSVKAILFGYACHNTTLNFYQFCGDYAGFAQQYLEESHPGAAALFMTGCGGDQNPYPRSTIELCRQHGQSLATAVAAALETVPRPLTGPLDLAWEEVELEFAPPPGREELLTLQSSKNLFEKRHATLLLKQLEQNGRIKTTYSYPIQVVRFGKDLTLVALAGEVVVDYALRFKRELPGPVWVAGYSNDVFGYVPSRRVLEEGGYEAGGAAMLYDLLRLVPLHPRSKTRSPGRSSGNGLACARSRGGPNASQDPKAGNRVPSPKEKTIISY